jgi:hypothetical protein
MYTRLFRSYSFLLMGLLGIPYIQGAQPDEVNYQLEWQFPEQVKNDLSTLKHVLFEEPQGQYDEDATQILHAAGINMPVSRGDTTDYEGDAIAFNSKELVLSATATLSLVQIITYGKLAQEGYWVKEWLYGVIPYYSGLATITAAFMRVLPGAMVPRLFKKRMVGTTSLTAFVMGIASTIFGAKWKEGALGYKWRKKQFKRAEKFALAHQLKKGIA